MGTPILGFIPESVYAYSIDQNLSPIATMPTTTADPDDIGITVCGMKDGSLLVLYDSTGAFSPSMYSILRRFDPVTGLQVGSDVVPSVNGQGVISTSPSIVETVLIGERGAYKSLMDLGCGLVLTNDRDTHQLIAVRVDTVTDTLSPNAPGSVVLESLTGSGFTATATKWAHPFHTGDQVVIDGADQAEYNGTFYITVTGTTTFEYSFSGTATPTATGTITATAVVSSETLGKVEKRYNLYVDPLDAAVNAAGTRLLYVEGDSVKLWDLEEDEFIRTIVSGIGGVVGGGGGSPGGGRCTGGVACTGTPDPALPAWFLTALTSLGATNCVDESLMGTATMKAAAWANGYAIQVDSGCGHRARLYNQGAAVMSKTNFCGDQDSGDYSHVVNLVAADHCSWAFL